ncbi:MAG: phosphonate ABC transporter, permease protein PhnE [Dehalococcoidia bacterium]
MAGLTEARSAGPAQISEEVRADLLRVWPRLSLSRLTLVLGMGVMLLWGLEATNAKPSELIGGIPNIKNFLVRMFPPSFDMTPETLQTPAINLGFVTIPRVGFEQVTFPFPEVLYSVIQTIQIAIVGSLFAILMSIPFALLAARNIAPHPAVYQTTRMLLNANRAIPDIIFALIFVAAVGLGPFGGVMALAVGSIGFMGKVFAEAIEAIDPEQVKAIRATGANRWQVISYAVVPQAMPLVLSYALLLFESNVRSATILGLVGAGGVGFVLSKYMALFQYDKLLGTLIFIVLMVTLVDRFSDFMRRRFI